MGEVNNEPPANKPHYRGEPDHPTKSIETTDFDASFNGIPVSKSNKTSEKETDNSTSSENHKPIKDRKAEKKSKPHRIWPLKVPHWLPSASKSKDQSTEQNSEKPKTESHNTLTTEKQTDASNTDQTENTQTTIATMLPGGVKKQQKGATSSSAITKTSNSKNASKHPQKLAATEIDKYKEECREAVSHRNAEERLPPILEGIDDLATLETLRKDASSRAAYETYNKSSEPVGFHGEKAFRNRANKLEENVTIQTANQKPDLMTSPVKAVKPSPWWHWFKPSNIASNIKSIPARLQKWYDPHGLSDEQMILLIGRELEKNNNVNQLSLEDLIKSTGFIEGVADKVRNICQSIASKDDSAIYDKHIKIMDLAPELLTDDDIKRIAVSNNNKATKSLFTRAQKQKEQEASFVEQNFEVAFRIVQQAVVDHVEGTLRKTPQKKEFNQLVKAGKQLDRETPNSISHASKIFKDHIKYQQIFNTDEYSQLKLLFTECKDPSDKTIFREKAKTIIVQKNRNQKALLFKASTLMQNVISAEKKQIEKLVTVQGMTEEKAKKEVKNIKTLKADGYLVVVAQNFFPIPDDAPIEQLQKRMAEAAKDAKEQGFVNELLLTIQEMKL